MRKGLDWIVANQKKDGALVGSLPVGGRSNYHQNYMYEHGMAAFALGDACATALAAGEQPDARYMKSLRRAVKFIERNQHDDGGWRYNNNHAAASDTSVTGWQVLALKSAKEAGIPAGDKCIEKVREYFLSRETGANGRTCYQPGQPGTEALTGVGMLAKQFLLDEPDAPLVKNAARHWPASPSAAGLATH